jgi:hypothetical protein
MEEIKKMKLKYLALEAKTKCPAPTQDIAFNLKNKQTAIDEFVVRVPHSM